MPQGTTTVDFGAWPGSGDTSVTITGQTNIGSGSLVEAWIFPAATADHSVDEHWVDPPRVVAGNIVVGTGFTIYATSRLGPAVQQTDPYFSSDRQRPDPSYADNTHYGVWNVAWVWN